MGRDIGRSAVGIIAVEVGFRGLVLPKDFRVGSPFRRVAETHVVDMVSARLQRSRSRTVIVDDIDADLVTAFVGGVCGAGPNTHRNIDWDLGRFHRRGFISRVAVFGTGGNQHDGCCKKNSFHK